LEPIDIIVTTAELQRDMRVEAVTTEFGDDDPAPQFDAKHNELFGQQRSSCPASQDERVERV
jgi:hypothetical protein